MAKYWVMVITAQIISNPKRYNWTKDYDSKNMIIKNNLIRIESYKKLNIHVFDYCCKSHIFCKKVKKCSSKFAQPNKYGCAR